jgi:hypothetical protein
MNYFKISEKKESALRGVWRAHRSKLDLSAVVELLAFVPQPLLFVLSTIDSAPCQTVISRLK